MFVELGLSQITDCFRIEFVKCVQNYFLLEVVKLHKFVGK